jgi:hypothetical protein
MQRKISIAADGAKSTQNEELNRNDLKTHGFKVKTNIKAGPTCGTCWS